jgi:activating signal cointegrator 1
MKALTLTQPWAQLVIDGRKTFETRGWYVGYRGPLAIHAAKGWTADDRAFAEELGYDPGTLTRGAVLGEVELVACLRSEQVRGLIKGMLGEPRLELQYGDFSSGRWAWELRHVVVYPNPIPARGMLGLWDWVPA